VLADDCALTVRVAELGLPEPRARLAAARPPLRVVLDSRLRTPAAARVIDGAAPTLVLHGAAAAVPAHLAAGTVACQALPAGAGGLDMDALVAALAARQCNEILLESGPRLAGALLRAGLLDELVIYMSATLLGDRARPLLELPLDTMAQQVPLQFTDVRRVGEDWRFTAVPR